MMSDLFLGVGLLCQYHSEVISWESRPEMTCYVWSEMVNCTHSHTVKCVCAPVAAENAIDRIVPVVGLQ